MNAAEAIRYSIVIPFYNEQENIPPLYVKITEVMGGVGEPYEMVFVDDGSSDQSFKVLAQIQEHDRRVHVLRLRRNFGQTAALKAGFDFARGEIVIAMDGDLQYDPAEIPAFLEKMKLGYDIVSGWREERTDRWLTRRLPSRVANRLMAWLSGVPIHDFGCTYKAYRREILQEIQLYGELHRFIPALASWHGASMAEIPIRVVPRKSGKSNYGISRTFRVLLDLLSVKFVLDYATRPLHFFGLFGLLGTGVGAAISLVLLFKKVALGEHIMVEHGPLLLLGIALVISGIQFFSIGLIGEMLSRTYYESQKKPIYSIREVRSQRRESLEEDVRDTEPPRP